MENQTKLIVVCLVFLVLLGGCIEDTSGGIGLSPLPETQENEFRYDGQVKISGIGEGCFDNVRVDLYTADLKPIDTTHVGTLCYNDNATPKAKNITITANTQPTYIIVESPDYWENETGPSPAGYAVRPDADYYDEYPLTRPDQIRPTGTYADPIRTNTSTVPSPNASVTLLFHQHTIAPDSKQGSARGKSTYRV